MLLGLWGILSLRDIIFGRDLVNFSVFNFLAFGISFFRYLGICCSGIVFVVSLLAIFRDLALALVICFRENLRGGCQN